MRLILVGCEYAGKTTLAEEIVAWTGRTMGGGRVFHDHFTIPNPEMTPESQEQFLGVDPGLSVDSHYFLAHGVISVDDTVQHFYSMIEQGRGGFAVIYRSRGAY